MAVPARPYDALYDASTYTVSGARDHYRQQTVAGGFMVERAPNYPNMFSELPHMPASGYRFKNSDKVPAFVDRTFQQTQPSSFELQTRSQPGQITGTNRYKYFRRPLLAAPDAVIIKQAPQQPLPPPPPPVEEPKSKTVATQSDYRENEVQTTPWDPDYVLPEPSIKQQALSAKYHCDVPELLKLRDLKFGDGLPPGLQEVRRIEKLREKRAFEATLPPLSDVERLPLRQQMLDEWESKEWAEREGEILSVQDERLALLEQALIAREDEFDEATMQRVENRKTMMLQQRTERFATIQANRIKTMRQIIEARKYVEKPRKLHKLTVVEKYANFGSSAYAPVQRDGRFPDSKPHGKTIETEGFQPATLQGLAELETYLPSRLLDPRIAAPVKPAKLNYQQRQDAAVQRDLKAINDLLDTAKASKGRGVGECWPAPLKDTADARKSARARTAARNTDRPDTPVLPPSATAGREAAAVLLQRLLRGRAAQNVMYEGKTRCQALIQELSLEGHGATTRPEDTDTDASLGALIGLVFSTLCSALSENNPVSRAEKLSALYGPDMAPPPEDDEAAAAAYAAASAAPSRAVSRPATASRSGPKGVAFDGDAEEEEEREAAAPRPHVFERVETKVYTEAGERAVHDAVFARVNTMANTVAGAVATEMAAAVAAAMEAVAEEVKRISDSGQAAAMAEAAAAAARASATGEAEGEAGAEAAGLSSLVEEQEQEEEQEQQAAPAAAEEEEATEAKGVSTVEAEGLVAAEAEGLAAAEGDSLAAAEGAAEAEGLAAAGAEGLVAAEGDSLAAAEGELSAVPRATEEQDVTAAVHVPVPPAGRPRSGSSRPTSAAARPVSAGAPPPAAVPEADGDAAPELASGSSAAEGIGADDEGVAGTAIAERSQAEAGLAGDEHEQSAAVAADEGQEGQGAAPEAEAMVQGEGSFALAAAAGGSEEEAGPDPTLAEAEAEATPDAAADVRPEASAAAAAEAQATEAEAEAEAEATAEASAAPAQVDVLDADVLAEDGAASRPTGEEADGEAEPSAAEAEAGAEASAAEAETSVAAEEQAGTALTEATEEAPASDATAATEQEATEQEATEQEATEQEATLAAEQEELAAAAEAEAVAEAEAAAAEAEAEAEAEAGAAEAEAEAEAEAGAAEAEAEAAAAETREAEGAEEREGARAGTGEGEGIREGEGAASEAIGDAAGVVEADALADASTSQDAAEPEPEEAQQAAQEEGPGPDHNLAQEGEGAGAEGEEGAGEGEGGVGEQAAEPEVTAEASLAGGEEGPAAREEEELVGEASLGHALHARAAAEGSAVAVEGSGDLEGEVSLGDGDIA